MFRFKHNLTVLIATRFSNHPSSGYVVMRAKQPTPLRPAIRQNERLYGVVS